MAETLRALPETAAEMDWDAAAGILADAAHGADDGELFVEDSRTESFLWDDGRLKSASFDATQGFGLRVVAGERAGYGHASVLDTEAVSRAAEAARAVKLGQEATLAAGPTRVNRQLYRDFDPTRRRASPTRPPCWPRSTPIAGPGSARGAGGACSRARTGLTILRPDGERFKDHRPLVRVNVSVTVERDGRRESGSAGAGGREPYEVFIQPDRWKATTKRCASRW